MLELEQSKILRATKACLVDAREEAYLQVESWARLSAEDSVALIR